MTVPQWTKYYGDSGDSIVATMTGIEGTINTATAVVWYEGSPGDEDNSIDLPVTGAASINGYEVTMPLDGWLDAETVSRRWRIRWIINGVTWPEEEPGIIDVQERTKW